MAKKKKTPKATIKRAHKIARKIGKRKGVDNEWAVGMSVAKKSAARRKRKRSR